MAPGSAATACSQGKAIAGIRCSAVAGSIRLVWANASLDSTYASLDSVYPALDSTYASLDSTYASLDSIYASLDSVYPALTTGAS
ncbi:MAG: hypothetical protein ACI8PT_004282 [Gammaproteobacteria bacterium]